MQIIGTCRATGALAARLARIVIIGVAALLVAGSIATSLTRPAPQTITPEDAAQNDPAAIITTPAVGTLITLDESFVPVTPSPIAPPDPDVTAESMVWDATTASWTKPQLVTPSSAGYNAGDSVPVLIHVGGTVPGAHHQMALDYAGCAGRPTASFDRLATASDAEATPWVTDPGPGRERPDFTVVAPPANSGDESASILAWGATIEPDSSEGCAGVLLLEMVARAEDVWVAVWGRLRPDFAADSALGPVAVSIEPDSP
jgi:hypothetical protein